MSLDFDSGTLQRLEALYITRDARQRRLAILGSLKLKRGEKVLDIGAGAGFLTIEMADAVEVSGLVLGIDSSPTMLALARTRCEGRPWVQFRDGDATSLPVSDAAADVAVSIQVLEYVQNTRAALVEIHRSLRPGGRTAVVATDWDGIVWVSDDEQRMRKVLKAFEKHCAFTSLPRTLAPMLRAAGFKLDNVSVIPQLNLSCDEDSYSFHMIRIMQDFILKQKSVPEKDLLDWASELHALDRKGRYFFCLNQFLFTATRI